MAQRTTPESFRARLVRSGDCLVWTGRTIWSGYGQIGYQGKDVYVHRLAWLFAYGPIPEGVCVLHRCDNRPCCDPAHLFLGTQPQNIADMDAKGRRRPAYGKRNAKTKLDWKKVGEIRRRAAAGEMLTVLAAAYGVSPVQVGNIVRGKHWRGPPDGHDRAIGTAGAERGNPPLAAPLDR